MLFSFHDSFIRKFVNPSLDEQDLPFKDVDWSSRTNVKGAKSKTTNQIKIFNQE